MHIPMSTTLEQDVLLFRDALVPHGEADWDRGRWLYVPDFYCDYRYILGTRGNHSLLCIGINPSTARPDRLDNTLASVQRIAHGNGFDSFIMLNVYAQRATRPDDMEKELNPLLHRENLEALRYALAQAGDTPTIWAAWGNIIEKRPYLYGCVRDMIAVGEEAGARWVSCGRRSKKGHPHHPLYLKSTSPLDPFDAAAYCEQFISH